MLAYKPFKKRLSENVIVGVINWHSDFRKPFQKGLSEKAWSSNACIKEI